MRAVIYTRITEAEREATTYLLDQEHRCRDYARTLGFPIRLLHVIRDVADGWDGELPPGLEAIRDAIRAHSIDVVLVSTPDRISPVPELTLRFFDEAAAAQVRVIFTDDAA